MTESIERVPLRQAHSTGQLPGSLDARGQGQGQGRMQAIKPSPQQGQDPGHTPMKAAGHPIAHFECAWLARFMVTGFSSISVRVSVGEGGEGTSVRGDIQLK